MHARVPKSNVTGVSPASVHVRQGDGSREAEKEKRGGGKGRKRKALTEEVDSETERGSKRGPGSGTPSKKVKKSSARGESDEGGPEGELPSPGGAAEDDAINDDEEDDDSEPDDGAVQRRKKRRRKRRSSQGLVSPSHQRDDVQCGMGIVISISDAGFVAL